MGVGTWWPREPRPPSFQKTQNVPFLRSGKVPFAIVENVVQIAFVMIEYIFLSLPPDGNISGKKF